MSAIAAVLSRYRTVQVTTSTPAQIIALLYGGIFRFVGEARVAMNDKNRALAGEKIGRALAILELLVTSLDKEASPELFDQLEPIYMFCSGRLVMANVKQEPAILDEVTRVLEPLWDAWRQIAQ